MNRHGCIIDDKVDGAVSLPTLTRFVQDLINDIGRPVGRMLFPDSVGTEDDTDYFAFTIRYNTEEDMELKEHRDASVVTINVNLNLPDEEYHGSSLYLLDEEGGGSTRHSITFDPGMMLIHRGSVRHAALPITSGTRHNLVIWLFGEDGAVRIAPYDEDERLSVEQRWARESNNEQAVVTNSDARTVSGWKQLFEL
jgi:predicted 2-oxoglutarate/Fe(II)-dependent dioxygenase YbiX